LLQRPQVKQAETEASAEAEAAEAELVKMLALVEMVAPAASVRFMFLLGNRYTININRWL
jgi:hypothetical protein